MITKDALIVLILEMTRALGVMCQLQWTKTQSVFVIITIQLQRVLIGKGQMILFLIRASRTSIQHLLRLTMLIE